MLTDQNGQYFFRTVKPSPCPWLNLVTAWRPAHFHISVLGQAFCQRLITQMYVQGDPLLPHGPIVQTLPDPADLHRLVAAMR